jgi:copper(I)-binding protein
MKLFLLILLLMVSLPAFAQTQRMEAVPPVTVHKAYAFSTAPSQKNAAVFLTITNNSTVDDRLQTIEAPTITGGAGELHNNLREKDVVTMVKINTLDIPAGQTVVLDPAGKHIMLMDIYASLKAGQVFPLKLDFEKGGAVSVDVVVRPAGETEAAPHDGGNMHMHHQ